MNSLEEIHGEQKNEEQSGWQSNDPNDTGAQVVLHDVVVAPGDQSEVHEIHWLPVVLDRRDAVVSLLELAHSAVDEVALQHVVSLAVAREVVVDGADGAHLEVDVLHVPWRLQHVVPVESQRVNIALVLQKQFLDQVDLVVHDVQPIDVGEPGERILLDDAQVAVLDVQ